MCRIPFVAGLAKLDAPTWGAVASAVTAVSASVAAAPTDLGGMSAEDIAKAKWLAARDEQPSWLSGAAQPSAADLAAPHVASVSEDAAKTAWLKKLDMVREVGPVSAFGGEGPAPAGSPPPRGRLDPRACWRGRRGSGQAGVAGSPGCADLGQAQLH